MKNTIFSLLAFLFFSTSTLSAEPIKKTNYSASLSEKTVSLAPFQQAQSLRTGRAADRYTYLWRILIFAF